MAKITISIPDDVHVKASHAVEAGLASSVSAWFTELARREPDWATAAEIIADLASEAGVTEADRAEAAAAFAEAERAATDGLGGAV